MSEMRSSTTTGGSLPPVASPLDRGVQIQLARYALDGRTRPVDGALRLAARGSAAPGNDAGRSAWNTNARAARRRRVDGLGTCGRRPCRRLQRQRLISRATIAMRRHRTNDGTGRTAIAKATRSVRVIVPPPLTND